MSIQWSIFLRKHRRMFAVLWHVSVLLIFFTTAMPTDLKLFSSSDTLKIIYLVLAVPITLWTAFLIVEARPASPLHLMNLFESFSVTEKQLLQRHFQTVMEKSSGGIISNGEAMDLHEILNFEQSNNQSTDRSLSDQQQEAIAVLASTDLPLSNNSDTKIVEQKTHKLGRGRPRSFLTDQLHCKISSEVKDRLRERSKTTGVAYGIIVDETLREYFGAQDASLT